MRPVRIKITTKGVDSWIITDYAGLTLETANKYHKEVDGGSFAVAWNDPYIIRDYELGSPIFEEALQFALKVVHQSKGQSEYSLVHGLGDNNG